ncbi:MAG: SLOG family protein [Nanoarchaeota archaeon]|nr:SLOG family protein [Nanoarchaeota archaeon]
MTKIKLIIAGGRDFTDYNQLEHQFIQFTHQIEATISKELTNKDITIISGMAKGADILGLRLAEECEFNVERYPALWDKEGRSAGYKRNVRMADNATHLLAFWDGKSKGTEHMIKCAESKDLIVKVVDYRR